MLQNLHEMTDTAKTGVSRRPIGEVRTDVPPFAPGLAYTSPARGHWTVAHTPMLIPGSYMIFLCASACMRGVSLSVLEYGGMDRFSMIMLEDRDIYEGKLEHVMIDGVTEIIERLAQKPPIMMLFTSCIHHFIACDNAYIYKILRARFPEIDFVPCYMIPTIRKGHVTPEELMQVSLYDALEAPQQQEKKAVNLIGCHFAADPQNDYYQCLRKAGYTVRDLPAMHTYAEYKAMAGSAVNLYAYPVAHRAAGKLSRRLQQEGIYLPVSYSFAQIRRQITMLHEKLGISQEGLSAWLDRMQACAQQAISRARDVIGDAPIAIDHLVLPRICSLARLLTEQGFSVYAIYADAILPEEEEDLRWLGEHAPDIMLCATTNYACRMADRGFSRRTAQKVLAIGQKAAYFTGTQHFVNWIENGGYWGFYGICRLAEEMVRAYETAQDVPAMIQVKALGCSCV